MSEAKVCPRCDARYSADLRFCPLDGATLVATDPSAELIGGVIADRYSVLSKLGGGGMGDVYLAEHLRMKRKCAIKVMRPQLANDPVALGRFNREAENASQITHPNVAAVYDFGETSTGLVYLAMEYVDGEPLSDILEREKALHAVRASDIILQTAEGLSAAHALGILHRDLKPDNIMIAHGRGGSDVVKIVDFGIARVMTSEAQNVTSTGLIVGTPEYMSPEQLVGEQLDQRTDLYSLALVAFHVLTGDYAFPSVNSKDNLLARLTSRPRSVSEVKPDTPWPDALQPIFDRALASDRGDRFDDVLEFARALDEAIDSMPITQTAELYLRAIAARSKTPVRSLTPATARSVTNTPPVGAYTAVPTPPPIALAPDGADAFGARADATSNGDASGTAPVKRKRGVLAYAVGAAVIAIAAITARSLGIFGGGAGAAAPPPAAAATPAIDSTIKATNDSVPAMSAPPVALPATATSLDTSLVRNARASTLVIEASGGRTAALLADSGGLLVASSRALPADGDVVVVVDERTRVRGRVAAVDSARGLAVVVATLGRCRRCMPLAPSADAPTMAVGDSVLLLASGATSGTRPVRGSVGAIDNGTPRLAIGSERPSSGPVFAANGTLLGFAMPRGTALGFVPANALRGVVQRGRTRLASKEVAAPSDSVVAPLPAATSSNSFPVSAFAMVPPGSDRGEFTRPYRVKDGGFAVLVMTPQVMRWRDDRERLLLSQRHGGAVGAATPTQHLDALTEWRGWRDLVDNRKALIAIDAAPDLLAPPYHETNEMKNVDRGSVAAMALWRDGTRVPLISTATLSAVANQDLYKTKGKAVPMQGVIVVAYDAFAPTAAGGRAKIELELEDVQRPGKPVRITIPDALVDAIAKDFGGAKK